MFALLDWYCWNKLYPVIGYHTTTQYIYIYIYIYIYLLDIFWLICWWTLYSVDNAVTVICLCHTLSFITSADIACPSFGLYRTRHPIMQPYCRTPPNSELCEWGMNRLSSTLIRIISVCYNILYSWSPAERRFAISLVVESTRIENAIRPRREEIKQYKWVREDRMNPDSNWILHTIRIPSLCRGASLFAMQLWNNTIFYLFKAP